MFTKKWGKSGPQITGNHFIIISISQGDNMETFYGIMGAVALSIVIIFFQKKKKQKV